MPVASDCLIFESRSRSFRLTFLKILPLLFSQAQFGGLLMFYGLLLNASLWLWRCWGGWRSVCWGIWGDVNQLLLGLRQHGFGETHGMF